MRARASFCLTVAAALLSVHGASADDAATERGRTSSLSWIRLEGAESCIATQKLAQLVESRLARRVFVSAAEADVSVEGHVERSAHGFHASLQVRDAAGTPLGTREVDTEEHTCDALTESLVFAVAVMIDPKRAAPAPTPPAPEPSSPRPAASAPPPAAVPNETPAPPPPFPAGAPGWRVELEGNAAIALGILPGADPGTTVEAIVTPPRFWAIRAGWSHFFDSSAAAPAGAQASVSLDYGNILLCPVMADTQRVAFSACAGGQVGLLRFRGTGFPETNVSGHEIDINAAVLGEVALRLVAPLSLQARMTGIVPLHRDALAYTAADGATQAIFRPAAIGGVAEIGIGLRFR